VRPGIVLVNPSRPCTDGQLELFTDNDWQLIEKRLPRSAADRHRRAM
jgi:hypothetical protein